MACNSNNRRQWRKQEVAVGTAASKMRANAKQMLEPQPVFVSEEKAADTRADSTIAVLCKKVRHRTAF